MILITKNCIPHNEGLHIDRKNPTDQVAKAPYFQKIRKIHHAKKPQSLRALQENFNPEEEL